MEQEKVVLIQFLNDPFSNTGQPIKFHLGYQVYLSIPTYLFCLGVPCVFLPKNNHNLPTPDFLYSRSSSSVLFFGWWPMNHVTYQAE